METKRCLFCDKTVPIKRKGDYDSYLSCFCAPDGSYQLRRDSYEAFQSLSYPMQRQLFPMISGYIRDMTESGEAVTLSIDDLDMIRNSPRIPATIEEKAALLLKFLHRRSGGPDEPVVIRQLSEHYNLTYSPNLQELIYIIEKLRDEQLLERSGTIFTLTEKGWKEASARLEGRRLKPCFVLLADQDELRKLWSDKIMPLLERCGYFPHMTEHASRMKLDDQALQQISESKLVIADLTGHDPQVYFAAGVALGKDIPVVWTVRSSDADSLPIRSSQVRPFVWDSVEELADFLQPRLTQ